MLCLSGFELYSCWVPPASLIESFELLKMFSEDKNLHLFYFPIFKITFLNNTLTNKKPHYTKSCVFILQIVLILTR